MLKLLLFIALFLMSVEAFPQTTSEGFFSSQSSYALVSDTLDLSRGSILGLSFRTCSPGGILKQTWDNYDQFKMEVEQFGNLVLTLTSMALEVEIKTASISANLLDAQWHTILISVDEVTSDLDVTVM